MFSFSYFPFLFFFNFENYFSVLFVLAGRLRSIVRGSTFFGPLLLSGSICGPVTCRQLGCPFNRGNLALT
jgi:hypothetical protein